MYSVNLCQLHLSCKKESKAGNKRENRNNVIVFMITMRNMWMLKITIVMTVMRILVARLLRIKTETMIKKNNEVRFCTHAQVCADDQVIRATSPHTAPVRGPCHPHGAATAVGLRGSFGLWRRGRRWWWWWNWNTHTYWQRTGRGRGVWGAAALKSIALYWIGEFSQDPHDDTFHDSLFHSSDTFPKLTHKLLFTDSRTDPKSHTYPKNVTNVCTHLVLCIRESARSCSGSALALHTSAAGKQIARSPVWLGYPAPGTHPRSECQHSCCHGNTGKVTEIAWLSEVTGTSG